MNMASIDEPIAIIQEGKLRGTTGKNLDGEIFYKFFGIRYGKPPINELRFQPPEPIEPWKGIQDATQVGSGSIGRDDITHEVMGSEDCLFLNVYTRNLPISSTSKLRPVMVYIHGGGLVFGSSRPGLNGPEFFMLKDIVLVTMNYRLGALGFLSVDGTEVTGNMGLKDQNLALKWVKRNIRSFNGDPDNITIFGESAGSGSVHAHILSSASKGLFHKAILQSGCTLNSWFWGCKNNAREIVKHLRKTAETEQEALEILKKTPAMDVFNAQEKLMDVMYPSCRRPFSAVVENDNDRAFLTKDPREILKEASYNHVPMLMGYTDTEGMLIELISKFNVVIPPFQIEDMLPYELKLPKESRESKDAIAMLEKAYSKGSNYDLITDGCFLHSITEAALTHSKTGKHPVYFYRVSVTSELNHFKRIMKRVDKPGVCHADDLGYIWHTDLTPEIKPGSLEDKSMRTFVELWTNFAEFGDPTPNNTLFNITWPPLESRENFDVLDIGEKLEVKDIPERQRMEAWWDVYKKWKPNKIFE